MDSRKQRSASRKHVSRRAFLQRSAATLGSFGLPSLLGNVAMADDAALAPFRLPEASAKRVVMIFLNGALSHLDTVVEKPLLAQRRGEEIPPSVLRNRGVLDATAERGNFPVIGSRFEFSNVGNAGMRFSELVPHLGAIADDLCLVQTLQTDHVLHESAISVLLTGTQLLGRPSWGSWVSYALGRLTEDIPEFVVLSSSPQGDSPSQPRLWGSGFLPGRYQGVKFRSGKQPVLDVTNPPGVGEEQRGSVLDAVRRLNELESERSGDPDVQTRIQAYEMAARMQLSVPELCDLSKEDPATLERYGADPNQPSFASNCVLARRLLERGARFVQLIDGGWDHHGGIPRVLPRKCRQIDKPSAALITDLKERGLLEDTLVVLVSEFGRTPHCEGGLSADSYGRDHHNIAFPALLAGGGVRPGMIHGETDEWGWDVVRDPAHVHDLHATALHCLGLDHERLVHRHQGRDFRLTDVAGRVMSEILV